MDILEGVVSNVSQQTKTSGSFDNRGGRISSSTNITFRVDNKPISILLHDHIDIAEGERVTVAGVQKQNILPPMR
ncbi:hypothetical protein [Shewanella sp.]|uniref:hypothetical protein n=1 Tax=Shewanella sp. TaxID=50422 RepID=UPI001EC9DB84|nr:hypothetical protein [Shewanella sp.]NRB25880.1 hypothetical protein [Shewanella sp.]